METEAREWLKKNKNESALASNRFGNTSAALSFVEKLYGLGAEEVLVKDILDEEWRIKEEGGPYAESLIVMLPKDKDKRKQLFEVINKEVKQETGETNEDLGQDREFLWWD